MEQAGAIEADPRSKALATCMVNTHLSPSDDPSLKSRPGGWMLAVRDFLGYKGAGLIAPVAGTIKLMPGTRSEPAFR